MKRLIHEPLLHFLLLGGLIFALHSGKNGGAQKQRAAQSLRISEEEVLWLKEAWARQWRRGPSESELRGVVLDYLKESLLAREAVEIGLLENDTIIRRRLAQKMEFIVQDTARLAEPAEQVLHSYYEEHLEQYVEPARVSFTHIYFSHEKRQNAMADARATLEMLSRDGGSANSADELGDPLLLDTEFMRADQQEIVAQFGPKFGSSVLELTPGSWQGPIQSAYGLHLVKVSEKTDRKQSEFRMVREQVIDAWRAQEQRKSNERYFAGLLKKYDVVLADSLKPLIGLLPNVEAVP